MQAAFASYRPHANAQKMHETQAREYLVVAASGSGKSFSLRHDILRDAWNNPTDFTTLACAPTWSAVNELLERPIVNHAIRCGLLLDHCGEGEGFNKNEHRAILRNGKTIHFRSLEKGVPDKAVRGLDVHRASIDEVAYCPKYGVDVVKGRLVRTNGQLKMLTTPNGTRSWMYADYFGADARPHPHTEYGHYNIFDNPIITEAAVDRMKADLDPLMVRQEVYGEWVNLTENQVYHAFKAKFNVSDKVELSNRMQIYIGLDYNIGINGWLVGQKDFNTNQTWIIDEGYGARTTRDVAEQIKAQYGVNVVIVDDATGSIRQQADGVTNREILAQNGLVHIVANRSNPARVARYAVLNAHFENGKGEHRLKIHPRCQRLIKELETMAYRPNSDVPDDMGGKAGHLTDALGYFTFYLSGGKAAWAPAQRIHYAGVA